MFITNNPDTHQTIPTIPTHCAPRVTIADLRPKTFYISKLGQNTFINSAATNSTTGGPHLKPWPLSPLELCNRFIPDDYVSYKVKPNAKPR